MKERLPLAVLLAFLLMMAIAHMAAWQTIPERARSKPTNPIVSGRLVDTPSVASVEELAEGAKLIVIGTVTRTRSYLTADEEHILTDYRINSQEVLKGEAALSRTSPGTVAPLTLTVLGGDYAVDGVTVTEVDHSMKRLEEGKSYLLFLRPFGGATNQYQLHNFAAFELEQNELKPLTNSQHAYSAVVKHSLPTVKGRLKTLAGEKR
jgi:hypothetical protein